MALTAIRVERIKRAGRYGDGAGLWLQVTERGTKSWLLRFMLRGKARAMGLGAYPLVGLAEARDKARALRKMLVDGLDPLEEKRRQEAAKAPAIPFREVADLYIAAHEAGWRNEKHRWQWRNTLDRFVLPVMGELPVVSVATGDVMKALEPLWQEKPETASRVRGRIESVLDYASARGWRSGDNPARWRGHLANLLPSRDKVARVQHHAALPWREVGAFMVELAQREGMAALAMRFLILTAARSGEVRGAKWNEIDLAAKVWTVPGERMKAGREHRVPLSDAALGILHTVAPLRKAADGLVFPGGKMSHPLPDMALAMALRRLREGLTVHGFRSTFRDWCAEA
ncbi:MAG: tyrosine-type recombinase/integrase, partial [Acetobacteraceae bacterium]